MPPKYHRSNICLVGGNAVSAFLSWRLQATNACDVTLVWKQDFENVAQYGITMRYIAGSRTKLCRGDIHSMLGHRTLSWVMNASNLTQVSNYLFVESHLAHFSQL